MNYAKQHESEIKKAMRQIEQQFGKGAMMRMGDATAPSREIGVISSGSLSLDIALGIGGFPQGRIIEIFGPESSGKTTLALHLIAECQKQGGVGAFIDAEHALDIAYAQKLGVNVNDLLLSQPDYGEQALEIVDILIKSFQKESATDSKSKEITESNPPICIVVDSVAVLTPRSEIEGEMGDSHMGLHARLMSQALRKLIGHVKRSNAMLIFINQIRSKIGVMFGNPETTTGGNALKFYASVRLDIRRVGQITRGEEVIGSETRVKVVKNKMAPPFKQALFDIIYAEGISLESELIELGVRYGLVEKSGAWYSYDGKKMGQGKENARDYLKQHPELIKILREKILEKALQNNSALIIKSSAAENHQSSHSENAILDESLED